MVVQKFITTIRHTIWQLKNNKNKNHLSNIQLYYYVELKAQYRVVYCFGNIVFNSIKIILIKIFYLMCIVIIIIMFYITTINLSKNKTRQVFFYKDHILYATYMGSS